jgi:DNA-binding NarL/FixJ family response regulator
MESNNRCIQVVLASGSKLFLDGIGRIIRNESNIEIVVEASDHKEVEKCFREIKPKFLFIDNTTLDLDIGKLSNLINRKSPDTRLILFDNYRGDKPIFSNVIYINKGINSEELINTIKGLNKGTSNQKAPVADGTKYKPTRMEMKVIDLIVSGFSNKEIATELSISEKTVKAHLTNVFMKLGLHNRYQLIVYARKLKQRTK